MPLPTASRRRLRVMRPVWRIRSVWPALLGLTPRAIFGLARADLRDPLRHRHLELR
jgi:hypothetical protein